MSYKPDMNETVMDRIKVAKSWNLDSLLFLYTAKCQLKDFEQAVLENELTLRNVWIKVGEK